MLRMPERFVQQRLERWITTDHAVERDDGCGRNLQTDVNEVAVHELDRSKPIAPLRFLRRRSQVRWRRVHGSRPLDAALEQFKAQPADSRADIEQRAPHRTGAHQQVSRQTRGWPRPVLAISIQIALRDLLVEMGASDVAVGRAAGAHAIAFTSTRLSGVDVHPDDAVFQGRAFLGRAAKTIEALFDDDIFEPEMPEKRDKLCLRQSAGDSTGPEIDVLSDVFG